MLTDEDIWEMIREYDRDPEDFRWVIHLGKMIMAKGRIAGLEEAAVICDEHEDKAIDKHIRTEDPFDCGRSHEAESCVMAIRAAAEEAKKENGNG